MQSFSITGFIWRVVFAVALVLVTFNPTGQSYFHWVRGDFPSFKSTQAVLGIVLLGLWLFLWRSMMQAIGMLGFLLMAALTASLVWLFVSWGWLDMQDANTMVWVALIALGFILGVGMSWSIIRQRLTGQASVDQVDDIR